MTQLLTFLLGAGASYPYGVPVMKGFYSSFRVHIKRRYPQCFELVERLERSGRHLDPDLETLLSDLESILGTENGLRLIGTDPGSVASYASTARELRGYIDTFIVDTCEHFDREKAVREMKVLLGLCRFNPLHIFTTNYDRIIEFTCEYHDIAYSDGFEKAGDQPVAKWADCFDADIRVVKLHGSINWYTDDTGTALYRLDRGYALPAHDFRLVRGKQVLRRLMIIPTLEKEALTPPYIQLQMRFTDILKESRVLVVVGTSLRDRHILGYIQGRLENLHVLVVGPRASQKQDGFHGSNRVHTLDAGFSEFLTLGASALDGLVAELAEVRSSHNELIAGMIERFVEKVSSSLDDESVVRSNPDLARLWKQARDGSVAARTFAAEALSQFPHPVVLRTLVDLVGHDLDEPVRVSAASALAGLGGAEAIDALSVALLHDTSKLVQIEAALGLAKHRDGVAASESLRSALRRTDLSPAVRSVIADTVGDSGGLP